MKEERQQSGICKRETVENRFLTMKLSAAIVASSLLLGSAAAAFAPPASQQKTVTTTSRLQASFDNEIGAANLSGNTMCWDPLNFVTGQDQATFDKFRACEIKHGRIAQLAVLGYATTWHTDFRFPGCEGFPGGHAAVLEIPPADLLGPILAICGALEFAAFKQKAGSFPGDMGGGTVPVGFGPLFTKGLDQMKLRKQELYNGRAAMMGWTTLLVHEQLDGKPFVFFDHIDPYFPGPLAVGANIAASIAP
jgi:light-harvesting complex I chlorophyll a/b binding protein 1